MGVEPSPLWRRLVNRAKQEEGVTLVEAAIATPIFMLFMMAILEFGMVMNNYLALSASVRAGARTVSASGNDRKADLYTLLNISREGAAMDRAHIDYIVVYRPSGFGQGPTGGCEAGIAQADQCNVYQGYDLERAEVQVAEETSARQEDRVPNPALLSFGDCVLRPTASDCDWDPTTRKVTISGGGPDYVGVFIKFRHDWITRMFGTSMDLTDQSVIRLEPRSA